MKTRRNSLRVLLVEDREDDAELVRLTLSEANFAPAIQRVDTRAGVEACLRESTWDLILSDHNLPGMDSLDVLQMVGELGIATPFVILSGSIADAQAIEAMRRGARDFIHKNALGKLIPVIQRELATFEMAGELNRLSGNLMQLANFDPLTGLPNRATLLRELAQRVEQCAAGAPPFDLILVEINRFQHLSRSLGAQRANQVIAEVAWRLAGCAGPDNFMAHLGGDSFALVVSAADAKAQQATLASLTACVSQPIYIGDVELFITLSLGDCSFPAAAHCVETLFSHAETALFHARQTAGNSHRRFHSSMAGTGTREFVLEAALHHALNKREFALAYQPQVDLRSGRTVSVEALLRWQHPEWGPIAPLEFIPLLEKTGLIVPVGAWIIDTACAQLRAWEDAGHRPVRMAVNLSALQFGDAALTRVVADALRDHAIAPDRLELEITESIVMQAQDAAIAALRDLRRLGVRIAVDDFGTGYSSLSYLSRFPITTLKIDQAFVHECEDSPRDRALIETMIEMAHRLDLEIVAEGVETRQQADFLAARNCKFAQGYLFGRPMPADELGEHLAGSASKLPSDCGVAGVHIAPWKALLRNPWR